MSCMCTLKYRRIDLCNKKKGGLICLYWNKLTLNKKYCIDTM